MWFRYKLYGDINYTYVWLNTVQRYESLHVNRDRSDTLRKRITARYYGSRRTWQVTVGPDVLAGKGAGWTTIKNLWKATLIEIHTSTDSGTQPSTGYIVVERDGGDLPVQYVEGIDGLPSVTLNLVEAVASY